MGDVMKIELPYLHRERMGSGRWRYRVERWVGGERRRRTVRGDPGTEDFERSYRQALQAIEDDIEPASAMYPHGSTGWLVGEFLTTMERRCAAKLISDATLRRYRLQLGRLVAARSTKGRPIAMLSAAMPRRELIQIRDQLLQTPASADSFLKTVSSMYVWARTEEVLDVANPAEKVRRVNRGSDGFAIWDIDDVRAYLNHHLPGTLARLAMVLELCTAARRGDLVRLGPGSVQTFDGTPWICWKQEKPPQLNVEIPMLDMLADELARHDRKGETWLCLPNGDERSKKGFGNLFAAWCDAAGIEKRLHGIRKGLASILPEMGASNYHIDILLGHELGSEASNIYTRGAKRREIARELNSTWKGIRWE